MLKSTKRFILHTDGLNSQGFRMLTDGAQLDDFIKNPVLLFNHIRPKGNRKNQILPLGYWEDIELKDGVISAIPVFDETDDFAKAIYDKVEAGVIKMCSMGAEPLETSNDPSVLLAGQKLETVTKWLAKEGSLCDIGANPDSLAVALYDNNKMITLTESGIKTIPTSIKPTMKQNKQTAAALVKAKMVELSASLKTELKDSDTKVVAALEKHLVKLADDCATKMGCDDPEAALADEAPAPDDKDAQIAELKKQLAEALAKLEAATKQTELADEDPEKMLADETPANDKAVKLAAAALKLGKIRLNEVQSTITLATADYNGTVQMLKSKKVEPTVKSQIEGLTTGAEDRVIELSKKTWDDLFKKSGELEFLKLNAPDVFAAKYESKFGKKPKNV